MCSPRPQPAPPPTLSISERNRQLNALTIQIANEDKLGQKYAASNDRRLAAQIAAQPVDPNSEIFARGPQAPAAPFADHLELAPEKLQGLLAKRATSTLRIPATPPTSTQ